MSNRLNLVIFALVFPCSAHAADVYRCKQDGVTTFSDRPCARDASRYAADTSRVSTYDAPAASTASPKAPPTPRTSGKKRGDGGAAAHAKHAVSCDRIKTSIKAVRDKQRSGYSAKEGEKLKERLAKLEDQRRHERCR